MEQVEVGRSRIVKKTQERQEREGKKRMEKDGTGRRSIKLNGEV